MLRLPTRLAPNLLRRLSFHLLIIVTGLVDSNSGNAQPAAPPAAPLTESGVDLVVVKGGPRLLGAILERSPDGGVSIAVERAWLKTTHPRFFEQVARDEEAERQRGLVELRERLAAWIKRRADAEELLFFVKKEAARVDEALPKPDIAAKTSPQFMLLEFPRERIERIYAQPASRKQVALVAWRERLPNVEHQSVTSLARSLKKQGIDPAAELVDLSSELPRRSQDDREWAARVAIVEYMYRKRIDFQGTGDVVVRADDGAARPDFAVLAGEILKSQLAGLLDPDGTAKVKPEQAKWWEAATKSAEREQVTGFRLTRVDQDLSAKRVTVESRFSAQMPDGSWQVVWTQTEIADASKARPETEKAIAKDPQVSQAFKLAKAAGLSAEEPLQLALRTGAATMEAQQAIDTRFFEFRDRYLQHLDGPPLPVAPRAPAAP